MLPEIVCLCGMSIGTKNITQQEVQHPRTQPAKMYVITAGARASPLTPPGVITVTNPLLKSIRIGVPDDHQK